MSTDDEGVRAEIMVACRHDAAELAELTRRRMPEMTALHADESWRTYYRFGPGFHPQDNYLLIARLGGDGPLLGLVWADAAARTDAGVLEPWWCINALAVDERVAGQGLGRQLVKMVKDQAAAIGISSLYGLCYPTSADFWRKQGFSVGELGQGMRSDVPVRLSSGARKTFHTDGEAGNHCFTLPLGDGTADGNARLGLSPL